MLYLHTESASALKGCKTYSSATIIIYLPISYAVVVVGCLDLNKRYVLMLYFVPRWKVAYHNIIAY